MRRFNTWKRFNITIMGYRGKAHKHAEWMYLHFIPFNDLSKEGEE